MPRRLWGLPTRAAFPIEQKGTVICFYTLLGILKDSQERAIPEVYLKAMFLWKGGNPQLISAAVPRQVVY